MRDGAQDLPWGTQWDLVAAAAGSVDWTRFLVTLGFQDGRAGGRAPVNRYFGRCRQGSAGQVELGPFGMTMMAGPPESMAAETAYLGLLDKVRGYRSDDDRLALLDAEGEPLLTFVPSADPE